MLNNHDYGCTCCYCKHVQEQNNCQRELFQQIQNQAQNTKRSKPNNLKERFELTRKLKINKPRFVKMIDRLR